MKVYTLLTILLLQVLTVASLPIAPTVQRDVALPTHTRFDLRKLIARALPNLLPSRANANTNNNAANTKAAAAGTKGAAAAGAGAKGAAAAGTGAGAAAGAKTAAAKNPLTAAASSATAKGAAGSAAQQKAVMNAANSFANDVATVSSSLNTLGTTTDRTQVKQLATAGFKAEQDEDQHRAVLNSAAGNTAKAANQKIVANTPTVLNGLQSIMQNPSMNNVAKQLSTMEAARNKNILPSITQLSSSAFQAAGVNVQAKTFQPTSGTQKIKQLQAAGGN